MISSKARVFVDTTIKHNKVIPFSKRLVMNRDVANGVFEYVFVLGGGCQLPERIVVDRGSVFVVDGELC